MNNNNLGQGEAMPSDQQLAWWAKPNCKNCYGRGWLIFSQPHGEDEKKVCPCVGKRMKRGYL